MNRELYEKKNSASVRLQGKILACFRSIICLKFTDCMLTMVYAALSYLITNKFYLKIYIVYLNQT